MQDQIARCQLSLADALRRGDHGAASLFRAELARLSEPEPAVDPPRKPRATPSTKEKK